MLAIKVFENENHIGYISREGWSIVKERHEAMMFDTCDLGEAKRTARRFEDGYDSECNVKCKVVRFEITEYELE